MGRLESVENDLKTEKREHREDVNRLNDRISGLEKEIQDKDRQIEVLTEDNERLKRTLHNDSSNSSQLPSTDKPGKRPNTYNGREKSKKNGWRTERP